MYWGEEGDELVPLLEPATMAPGFPTRDEVRELYAERSGRDLAEIDFYVALGLWKLAIVSIVLFSVGGLFALYEAYHKWAEPHPIDSWKWVPVTVLIVAIVLEGVFARFAAGQYGRDDADEGVKQFANTVERLVEAADRAAARL